MSTPSGVPQAPVSAGGVEGQAAVIGEVAKEMYSLRFDGSSYLSRTATNASNQKTWTWSGWVKRSTLEGSYQFLFGKKPNVFRALFTIHGDEVRILHIRRASRRTMTAAELGDSL